MRLNPSFALAGLLAACAPGSHSHVHFSEGALGFRISELPSTRPGTRHWRATWDSAGQRTQFDIVLLVPPPGDSAPFEFTHGWLLRRAPSESGLFLAQLAALHHVPFGDIGFETHDSLPFTAAILGRDQSQGTSPSDLRAGAFRSDPPGPWLVTKLFLADGDAELFFNVDSADGVAEFVPKDPEYGRLLLPLLGSILKATH
jgi:hypothetical protein